jgi:hypothetical protein
MEQDLYYEEEEEEEAILISCPGCGNANFPLGPLGQLLWFVCRACGLQYHDNVEADNS